MESLTPTKYFSEIWIFILFFYCKVRKYGSIYHFMLIFIVKIVQFEPHTYKIVSDIELIIIIILNEQIIDPNYISCLCPYKIEILSL
jgi:hypothetical protein